jgi:hypothetical protein
MTPNQTVIFIEAFHRCATGMGWNQGTRQITTFTNSTRRPIDIIKICGKIDKATLESVCERFCKPGKHDAQTCSKQNNKTVSFCLAKSLTADTQARLQAYRNGYTFNGLEYAPLMNKIIIHLATIDSVATTQTLCKNLQSLGVYAATVSGNIDKVHNKFEKNNSQLIARAQLLPTPLASVLSLTLWSPATTSSHTFVNSTRATLMVNLPPSPMRHS